MTQPLDRVRLHAAYAAGLDPVAVIDQTFAAIAAEQSASASRSAPTRS